MKVLIIDTSTERGLVAISDGPHVLFSRTLPFGLKSSKYAMPAIQSGFEALGLSPCDLAAVAVAVGPGSFTGIRVGAALAKGIAFGASLPLISLCSLSGFISLQEGSFASVIDARVGGAYLLMQERKGEEIIELEMPSLIDIKELTRVISGCRSVVGPSFERLILPHATETTPDAEHLAKLAFRKLAAQEAKEDLEMIYLRETVVGISKNLEY